MEFAVHQFMAVTGDRAGRGWNISDSDPGDHAAAGDQPREHRAPRQRAPQPSGAHHYLSPPRSHPTQDQSSTLEIM